MLSRSIVRISRVRVGGVSARSRSGAKRVSCRYLAGDIRTAVADSELVLVVCYAQ